MHQRSVITLPLLLLTAPPSTTHVQFPACICCTYLTTSVQFYAANTTKNILSQVGEGTADVEVKLQGEGPWRLPDGADDIEMIFTPGHTEGHVVLYHAPSQSLLAGALSGLLACWLAVPGTADAAASVTTVAQRRCKLLQVMACSPLAARS